MIKSLILVFKIMCWHSKTFKGLNMTEQRDKLNQEINEFVEAKERFISSNLWRRHYLEKNMEEEMADVIIASINLLKYPYFYKKVLNKHNINLKRVWKGVRHVSK